MYKQKFVKPLRGVSASERFHHFVSPEPNSGCWLWAGCADKDGYGLIRVDGKNVRAHRFSFEMFHRTLEVKELVCHKCDNPACVNPEHLFAGTNSDNQIDCVRKNRKGEKQKLSVLDVKDIKAALKVGMRVTDIAKAYNVSVELLCNIKSGTKWAHVDNA